MFQMTEEIGRKILSIVDQGLSKGLGQRKEGETQGEMCVEAAVCYALGLPHGDDPGCVAPALRSLKIRLNDSNWSSKEARAQGLRRLAIAQLGSKNELDEKKFVKRLVDYAIRISTPQALRSAASIIKNEKHKAELYEAANRCEKEGTRKSAQQARDITRSADDPAAYAAADASRDKALSDCAEAVVQILIELKAPGCQYLYLTE